MNTGNQVINILEIIKKSYKGYEFSTRREQQKCTVHLQ